MVLVAATRDGNKRLGYADYKSQKVCYYWQAGKCNRNPCRFLHREMPPRPGINGIPQKLSHSPADDRSFNPPSMSRRPRLASNNWVRNPSAGSAAVAPKAQDKIHGNGSASLTSKTEDKNHGAGSASVTPKAQDKNHGSGPDSVPPERENSKVCNNWLAGTCSCGDECRYLHSWVLGDCFTLLKQLKGHQKVITGVALPSGSNKLYSGSKDHSVRVWDCHTGQCEAVNNLGGEIGCMMTEGPWLYIGIPNAVMALNTQTTSGISLSGPVGQVYAIAVANDILLAGTEDGKILAWKIDAASNCFQPAASLEGHSLAVVSLVVSLLDDCDRVYSGSMDHTIRVWDLRNFQCTHTLTGHTSVVTSVLCWDQFLLSSSLDKTVKAWAATESGNIEVVHTHSEDNGVITLSGMYDAQKKPVLMCSCNDNTIRVYNLPSFSERGRILSREEVWTIQKAPTGLGLFFTGDGTGELSVWNWVTQPPNQP